MAKLKVPLLSFSATGPLSHLFSFAHRGKKHIIEHKPIPTDAQSPVQLFYRSMFTQCSTLWHTLSEAEQRQWETDARPLHMTGYAWFISQCLKPNPGIYLPLLGGTMQGDIDMATFRILDLTDPTQDQEADTKKARQDAITTDIATHAAIPTAHQDAPTLIADHSGLPYAHHTPPSLYTEGARVYHNADQSIPNTSSTVLSFNSERYDTDTIHDNVTNNSRLTCKTAGKYLIIAHLLFAASGTGYRITTIILNGTTDISTTLSPAPSGTGSRAVVSTVYDLAISDYVYVSVFHNKGAPLSVKYQAQRSPEFMMQRIG